MKFSAFGYLASRLLKTKRGKNVASGALRRAADAANGATGNKHASKIEKARASAERRLRKR